MPYSFSEKKRPRKNMGSLQSPMEIPDLLGVQKRAYDAFLTGKEADKDSFYTLDGAFRAMFPMNDTAGIAMLEYVGCQLERPKFDVHECRTRDLTYSAPLRATLRLTLWDTDAATGAKKVKDIKEQDIYLADMPLMTNNGTFIVNGTERVVVSQMQRSPGVFFDHDNGTTHASGKLLFSGRVIPFRGSWLDFEFDHKDNLYVRIDRRRKMPATVVLRALGMSTQDIIDTYYDKVDVRVGKKKANPYELAFTPMFYEGVKQVTDLVDAESGEAIVPAGKKATRRAMKKAQEAGTNWVRQEPEDLLGRFLAEAVVDKETGEVLYEAGAEVTQDVLTALDELKTKSFKILKVDHLNVGAYIRNTLAIDKSSTPEEALIEIYKVMRPGEPPTVEAATKLFEGMFFDADRFDLSAVGRMKMNARLDFDEDEGTRVLRKEDIAETVRKLLDIRDGRDMIDDIDHLGNRRVRLVGELMENQVRVGLLRMEKSVKERMGSTEIHNMTPNDIVNARPLSAALREFFAGSQLSQFMDQTNPLSEVTHKRRLSALGPGGLTRERAGFEVRDVHPTHYGRICPVETPEGPNIGLINSLASYARINKYGFIETPYRKVVDGKATDEIVYMSAIKEAKEVIAQANTELDEKSNIKEDIVICRKAGETMNMPKAEVTYMDVSPMQVVSAASALIPFLEHDDANRALMGSNMQRQAVPLLKPDAPLVGTGMEAKIARDSGVTIVTERGGVIESVDAQRIVLRVTDEVAEGQSGVDVYRLMKFQRSNQNSCMTQRPLVKVGDVVQAGDIIADGPSTDKGELATGRNTLVAFMPWNGYNFEDSILISERIVRDDIFTSIHIDEFESAARDTKLGPEEVTRDIPNVSEEALKNLDDAGIIRIGAEVKPGDILVGKITPKGETPVTPEEKLLRAIFGEKAADVRDTSLRTPPGLHGTVVGVKVFNRRGTEKDVRSLQIEEAELDRLKKDVADEKRILQEDAANRIRDLMIGQKAAAKVGEIAKGKEITTEQVASLHITELKKVAVADEKAQQSIEKIVQRLEQDVKNLNEWFEEKQEKIRQADDLAPGMLKMVKVFIAVKRKLQPGDKMAGRHGNKGVISKVCPIEDMPYMEDGTPVDMVLNPLGVPSRMNVGQILETHLGGAALEIGRRISKAIEAVEQDPKTMKDLKTELKDLYKEGTDQKAFDSLNDEELLEIARNIQKGLPMACPVFDGPNEETIDQMLARVDRDTTGKVQLYDGCSGEAFEQKTTVGVMYMLKLHHLVDEKMHARSIGPYSLVTQQPLGGKAQFGGQRFGEMEVWALQAYGASYTLQEMLTVKSDDVSGRTKTYEAIVRGEQTFEAGVPESFNVLSKEIQALGLNMELLSKEQLAEKDVTPSIPALPEAVGTDMSDQG